MERPTQDNAAPGECAPGHVWRSLGKSSLGIALLVSLCSGAQNAQAQSRDDWWGRDKALHLGVSGVIGASGYAASSLALEARPKRAAAGVALALSAGVAKELYDLAGHGQPSYKDMVFNVAGTALGVSVAYLIDLASSSDRANTGCRRYSPLTMHF
jgi:putative lipoprotein